MTKLYSIKILIWSATDYSFLVNNTNGWVDDTGSFYEFDDLEDFEKMKEYLEDFEKMKEYLKNDKNIS